MRDTGRPQKGVYLTIGAGERAEGREVGSADPVGGRYRPDEELLALGRNGVPVPRRPLALPGVLARRLDGDETVPEEEADGELDLDVALGDPPEVMEPVLDLDELERLLDLRALALGVGRVQMAQDLHQGRPNRVLLGDLTAGSPHGVEKY